MKRAIPLAFAATILAGAVPAMSMTMESSLPPSFRQGAVSYRSGGIGINEAKAMEKAASRYPLSLEFVKRA